MEKRFEVKEINSKFIIVDRTYQHELDQARVTKLLKQFDPVIANLPKVSFRFGKYYVFDGQHTIALLKAVNNHEDLPILCKVYEGMTSADEAHYFLMQNGLSKLPTISEKFHAAYNYGDEDITAIVKIAEAHGFSVNIDGATHSSPCLIRALKAVLTVYQKFGATVYEKMLSIIKEAWDGDNDSTRKEIITGLALFCFKYNGKYDRQILVKKLTGIKPSVIIRDANASGYSSMTKYAKRILQAYNKNLVSNRLDDEL